MLGIHIDRCDQSTNFVKRYEAILDYNKIKYCFLDSSDDLFFEKVSGLSLFIFRWHHTDYHHQLANSIIPVIQNEYKVKCYPNWESCWHFDDKIKQYYLLKKYGLPYTKSYIFWDKKSALLWLDSACLPVVFKLKGGAGSSNVILLNNKFQVMRIINRMFHSGISSGELTFWSNLHTRRYDLLVKFKKVIKKCLYEIVKPEDYYSSWMKHKNYVLFQEYLPENKYDTRVTIIGDRAFAFRRFNRKNDFRSSGGNERSYDPSFIDLRFIEMAFNISNQLKAQSMSYDFLYGKNGEVQFCEMSYTSNGRGVYNCPGYWDSSLRWHEGHYWPEYCHLIDALDIPYLRQPDIEYF